MFHTYVYVCVCVSVQNAELFTLTYGAIVRQLLTDLEEVDEVNKQLDQMYLCICFFFVFILYFCVIVCVLICKCVIYRGYNIGIRLIDEFLAKSNISTCVDFKETAEVIAKVPLFFVHFYAFLVYLSVILLVVAY